MTIREGKVQTYQTRRIAEEAIKSLPDDGIEYRAEEGRDHRYKIAAYDENGDFIEFK